MCATPGEHLIIVAKTRRYTSRAMVVMVLLMVVLFLLFLLPFDRRFIERYIMRIGALPTAAASTRGESRSGQMVTEGLRDTTVPGGPYTRQICKLLDLQVVRFAPRKFFFRSRPVKLAIGRWNEKAREFEVVTAWCTTWEELEEEARQAVKSFREIANPKYRGA